MASENEKYETLADIVADLRGRAGNAAAMRAALEKIKALLGECYNGELYEKADEAIAVADSALSAPARQCDVGTAEEQAERFKKFCFDHQAPWHGCTNCPVLMSEKCALTWAQTPYAEEGAGK